MKYYNPWHIQNAKLTATVKHYTLCYKAETNTPL